MTNPRATPAIRPLTVAEMMTGQRMTDEEYADSMQQWRRDSPQSAALETAASLYDDEAFQLEVIKKQFHTRAREEADRQLRAGKREPVPDGVGLADFLAEADEETRWRIGDLLPVEGNVILSAQAKGGKTTLIRNVVRSLTEGDDFLGRFHTNPVQRVAVIDTEMPANLLRTEMRRQGYKHPDRVKVWPLKGRMSSFDLLDPACRDDWAEKLHGSDVVILDPLSPVLESLGIDPDHGVGPFLLAWDELLTKIGLNGKAEGIIVHHMGHEGTRPRNSSRLRDWPDMEWFLTRRDPDNETGPRYFQTGRVRVGPGVARTELVFDPHTGRELLGAPQSGSGTKATGVALWQSLADVIAETPGLNASQIKERVKTNGLDAGDRAIDKALTAMAEDDRIYRRRGKDNAWIHYPVSTGSDYGVSLA